MNLKFALLIIIVVATSSLFVNQTVYAQSNQVSNSLTLSHLSIQLTYPSEVLPGQSATVNVKAKALDNFQLNSFFIQVYLADPNTLRQLTNTTAAENVWMYSGDQINKDIQVAVPLDALRTSLIALVSENVRTTYYYYSYSYDWMGNYSYPYRFASPSFYSRTVSDDAVTSLTYIKAATPEYTALQSQYPQLQQSLNQTQGSLKQTQAQDQKLQADLQNAQNTITQKNSTLAGLNKQLASLQNTVTLLEAISVILVVLIVLLGLYSRGRKTNRAKDAGVTEKESA